jgi:hypothetical protein
MGVLRGMSGSFAALVVGCTFSGTGLAGDSSGEDTTDESSGGTSSGGATTEGAPPTTQGPGEPETTASTNDTSGESTAEVAATTGTDTGGSTAGESTAGESTAGESSTAECVAVDWYADMDMDGRGDAAALVTACDPPPGYVDNSDDCDDNDEEVSPILPEKCDNKDNDCDEMVDEYSEANKVCGGCTLVPDDADTPAKMYYFCDTPKKSWANAKSLCEGKGGALVADESDQEHEFLTAQLMILGAASGGWWTGGFAPDILGYQWLNEVAISGIDGRWDFPQIGADPNKCVQLLSPAVDNGGRWTPRSCNEVKPYICETTL